MLKNLEWAHLNSIMVHMLAEYSGLRIMRVLLLWLTLSTIWKGMNSPTAQSRTWMQHLDTLQLPQSKAHKVAGGEFFIRICPSCPAGGGFVVPPPPTHQQGYNHVWSAVLVHAGQIPISQEYQINPPSNDILYSRNKNVSI